MPPTPLHSKNPKADPLHEVLCWHCDTTMQKKALTEHHKRFQNDEEHKGKKKAYYKPRVMKMTFFNAPVKPELPEDKKEAKREEEKKEEGKKEEEKKKEEKKEKEKKEKEKRNGTIKRSRQTSLFEFESQLNHLKKEVGEILKKIFQIN